MIVIAGYNRHLQAIRCDVRSTQGQCETPCGAYFHFFCLFLLFRGVEGKKKWMIYSEKAHSKTMLYCLLAKLSLHLRSLLQGGVSLDAGGPRSSQKRGVEKDRGENVKSKGKSR